jgi:hypothetical protein
MKTLFIFFFIVSFVSLFGQGGINKDDFLRGPSNIKQNGVIDGVIIKDELPIRSKIDYEHVRLADYVWSKRVFSRIDSREKINHPIFFPNDEINQDFYSFPASPKEIDSNRYWLKHEERLSLWTIIEKHTMLGDLTIYKVNSEENGLIEDGFQFKYPIVKNNRKDAFFTNASYKSQVSKCFSVGSKPTDYTIPNPNAKGQDLILMKTSKTFRRWLDSLTDPNGVVPLDDNATSKVTIFDQLNVIMADSKYSKELEDAWNAAKDSAYLQKPAIVKYITSNCILAYNIKEDWFFDKERSILDRRIIAIAPVGRYITTEPLPGQDEEPLDRFSSFVLVGRDGSLLTFGPDPKTPTNMLLKSLELQPGERLVEKEMFWLYFPELRDVIVNYYTYNDKSDSQWMSFDDLFWKRKFISTIYRVSDKFDREIEDYKYGVDALYEAERIKDDIRKWEIDVWNY